MMSAQQRANQPARRITGPQSALTDFLASHNIDANRIRQDADARRAAALVSRQAADADTEESASPDAEPEPAPRRANESKAQQTKRKKEEEKAIAKIKASKSFQRRRRALDTVGQSDEDEDEAARSIFDTRRAPMPGQMENCKVCDVRFTVTTYSRSGPDGGLLCAKCSKELDKEAPPKKKRKLANRRRIQSNVLDGTFHRGAKDLKTLCIETLAKNVELAVDFGDLPPKVIDRLAAILSKKRLVTSTTLNLFLTPGTEIITVYDAARLSKEDFTRIFQMVPTMRHLRVRNAIQFKNVVMDYLTGSTVQLESFSIHGANLIDDEHWNSFLTKKGRHLRALKVYWTDGHFGDEQLELLKISCPELERLKISHNQKVTNEGIKHIAHLARLQHLSLKIYKPLSSEPYVEVIESIGNGLRTLSIAVENFIDDRVLDAIHENCDKLTKFRLTDNETFTDQGFTNLFTNWSNPPLTFVDLRKCRHIESTDPHKNVDNIGLCSSGFQALMAHSGSRLRYLNIYACRHISTEAFENVFAVDKVYPELKVMDVSFCTHVNDFVVGSIFRSCPNLQSLRIFGNFGVKEVRVPKGKILIGMPYGSGMEIEGTY